MQPTFDPVAHPHTKIPDLHKPRLDHGIKLAESTVAWEQAVEKQLGYVHDAWTASQELEILVENIAFDLYEKGDEVEQTLVQANNKFAAAVKVRNESLPVFANECLTTHSAVITRVRNYLSSCEKIYDKYQVQHYYYTRFYKLNRKMAWVLAQAFAEGLIQKRFE
jgi:hypothetical protein